MSGSGGGFGGGSYGDPVVSCERLIIDTSISSPKAPVIGRLTVGDVLQVTIEAQGGAVVIVLTHHGDKVGGIASASTNRLRECIELGTLYEATVTSISGGQVQVRIKAVRN